MKNKTPFIFSLSLLLALAFGSCKTPPCPEYEVKVDTATLNESNKEPLQSYHGFDTLKFLTEKGDTIAFLGQGKNVGYKKVDNFAEDNCSTKSTTYKQFEGYTFYPTKDYPSEIEYYVSRDLNSTGGIYFYIIIDKIAYYRSPFLPIEGSSVYIDNFIVNGNTFNKVFKIYRNYNSNEKSYIYYNKSDGILQVNFSNGNTLSKIK
jgi:hypothetical protein